jgi:hypothetical protein
VIGGEIPLIDSARKVIQPGYRKESGGSPDGGAAVEAAPPEVAGTADDATAEEVAEVVADVAPDAPEGRVYRRTPESNGANLPG